MTSYIFILGVAASLCEAELLAVLTQQHIRFTRIKRTDNILILSLPETVDVKQLLLQLGGTIKIAKVLDTVSGISVQTIIPIITHSTAQGSLTFGFSNYTSHLVSLPTLSREIKQELSKQQISARYVLPKNDRELSSVVIKKQQVTEFIFAQSETDQIYISQTIIVQDSDAWSLRDYGRPCADAHAGMLPIKVARMLVNLALSESPEPKKVTIYDPFCGMGTILSEALFMGCPVRGSDITESVVEKAAKNLSWLKETYHLTTASIQLFTSDATHVSEQIPANSINIIVTEPFMGTPFEKKGTILYQRGKQTTKQHIANTIKGLEKLYIGCLREWYKIVKPGGRIVMVLPAIQIHNTVSTVKKMIDNCEKLGYTTEQGPFEYARPQAVVKRDIYIFRKVKI